MLGIPAQSARTFVVVQSVVNLSGRIYTLVQGQTTSNLAWVGIDVNTFMTKGNLEGVYVTDHSFDSDLPTATGARLHVLMVQDMEIGVEILPRISYRVNSQTRTLTRNPGGLGDGTFEDFSGADFTFVGYGGSASASAYVAEALIYDHVLSAQELEQVEQTLSSRYGIAQPDAP